MKKHKVYISGQITGLPVAEYVEKFSKAEAELKAKGYEVVNPLRYELKPGSRWNEQNEGGYSPFARLRRDLYAF